MPSVLITGALRGFGSALTVHPGRLKTEVAPADADVEPRFAAIKLADWVERVDDKTSCGLHDLINGGLIEL